MMARLLNANWAFGVLHLEARIAQRPRHSITGGNILGMENIIIYY